MYIYIHTDIWHKNLFSFDFTKAFLKSETNGNLWIKQNNVVIVAHLKKFFT